MRTRPPLPPPARERRTAQARERPRRLPLMPRPFRRSAARRAAGGSLARFSAARRTPAGEPGQPTLEAASVEAASESEEVLEAADPIDADQLEPDTVPIDTTAEL